MLKINFRLLVLPLVLFACVAAYAQARNDRATVAQLQARNRSLAAANEKLRKENAQLKEQLRQLGVSPVTQSSQPQKFPYLTTPKIAQDVSRFNEAKQWAASMYRENSTFTIIDTNITEVWDDTRLIREIEGWYLDVAYEVDGERADTRFFLRIQIPAH